MKDEGFKNDSGKLNWTLLPFASLEGVVKVLTYGANVYGPFSWKKVENGRERYMAALIRHLVAYLEGEEFDRDSGLPHLDHMIANLLFARSAHWNKDTTLLDKESDFMEGR